MGCVSYSFCQMVVRYDGAKMKPPLPAFAWGSVELPLLAVLFVGIGFAQSMDCDALDKCQEALKANRNSSLIHFRIGEIYLQQNSYMNALNEFRSALDGDLIPKWIEAWAHVNMGKVYDASPSS